MARIVSLLPWATETIAAMGLADSLVGRSHRCISPRSVEAVPACTEPKHPVPESFYAASERDRQLVQEGLAVDRVDATLLAALRPELVVTQFDLDALGVDAGAVLRAARALLGNDVHVFQSAPRTLADVWRSIRMLSKACGREQEGRDLRRAMEQQMAGILRRAQGQVDRPRVACIASHSPFRLAGGWIPELVEMAGGRRLFRKPPRDLSWSLVAAADPDVIVIMLEDQPLDAANDALRHLRLHEGWEHLRAVSQEDVYVVDGSRYFFSPGPSLVESVEILAEILHPLEFQFAHEGTAWEHAA